jgi:hypothetical protein
MSGGDAGPPATSTFRRTVATISRVTSRPTPTSATTKAIATLALVALVALHLDFWRDRAAFPPLFGLPPELAYRIVWMALAVLYLAWFTKTFWRDEGRTR